MTYQIRPGTETDRRGIADTMAEAYFDQFKSLTQDREGVARGLAPMLHPERFTVAVEEQGGVVGTAALSDAAGYAITVLPQVLREAMGFIKGNLAAAALREMVTRPKAFRPGQAHLDFVAVRETARGRGLARQMLRHILDKRAYELYTLDVTEGNEAVLPLFEGLGFVRTGTEPEKAAALKGFSFRYLLAYRPEGAAHG
ncbi:MAG: GNAT family N-acetyltransferase [Clostridiales bacterium]|nr:GNAT family N-acetyltransferase [Clostridiales bacterium]